MFDLDAHFRLHAESLKLSSRRSELIARNLANAETPNYKARDLDFRKALATALGEGGGAVGMTATASGHLGGSQSMNLDNLLIDRTPLIELAAACGCTTVIGREMMRGQVSRMVDFFLAGGRPGP